MNDGNNLVAVLIPVYKTHINSLEKIALYRVLSVLGHYPIFFIAPQSLIFDYKEISISITTIYFSDSFFTSIQGYNRLMLDPQFYHKFLKWKYLLIYQLDAFVHSDKLMEFCHMGYDYIGAPWMLNCRQARNFSGRVGNGGFSLRKTDSVYNLLRTHSEIAQSWEDNEDLFFAYCGKHYPKSFHVAPYSVAIKFSSEYFPAKMKKLNNNNFPFGCHGWNRFSKDFYVDTFKLYDIDLKPFSHVLGNDDWVIKEYFLREMFLKWLLKSCKFPKFVSSISKEWTVVGIDKNGEYICKKLINAGIIISHIFDDTNYGSSVSGCYIEPLQNIQIYNHPILVLNIDNEFRYLQFLKNLYLAYGKDYFSALFEYSKMIPLFKNCITWKESDVMDAIDRAISRRDHENDIPCLQSIGWNDFEAAAKGKKLFIFGLGRGTDYFYHKYGSQWDVEGIIDNDSFVQGKFAQFFLSYKLPDKHQMIRVSSVSLLNQFKRHEIVILISSLRYYKEISCQLEKMGITNYFSLLCMEASYRKANNKKVLEDYTKATILKGVFVPIDKNKIVLLTMTDGAGHAKEIVRQILTRRHDMDIVWLTKSETAVVPHGVRKVLLQDDKAYTYEMSTAKYWIFDQNVPQQPNKRKGQVCIMLTHWAGVTLKEFGFGLARFRNDQEMTDTFEMIGGSLLDHFIVGSQFDANNCRERFGFHGDMFIAGSPRSDILFRPRNFREIICRVYNLSDDRKYLLYSPTFRAKTTEYIPIAENIDLDFESAKEALEKRFGGEWLILLRLHPVVASSSKDIPHPDYVIDVSDYYDSEELVAASDAMITDYSSIMFEPAFVHKPVFLLATDLEDYLKKEREFLIDYDKLPFPRASSNEELARNIENFDEERYVCDVDAFLEKYGVHEDGHASERAARFILDLIDGKRG